MRRWSANKFYKKMQASTDAPVRSKAQLRADTARLLDQLVAKEGAKAPADVAPLPTQLHVDLPAVEAGLQQLTDESSDRPLGERLKEARAPFDALLQQLFPETDEVLPERDED